MVVTRIISVNFKICSTQAMYKSMNVSAPYTNVGIYEFMLIIGWCFPPSRRMVSRWRETTLNLIKFSISLYRFGEQGNDKTRVSKN